MDKRVRNYKLSVEKPDGSILEIKNPLTLEFDIIRSILSSVNTAHIRVYNLGKDSRAHIRRDQFDFGLIKRIKLEAGYGENLSTIYKGTISKAWSVRQGVNYVTHIESEDGGWAEANAKTNVTFPKGISEKDMIASLIKTLKASNIEMGSVGNYSGNATRGAAYSGSTTTILKEVTGGGFFVDNEVAHCIEDNECLDGEVLIIDSSSGLLGTPVRQNLYVTFDILLEPRLKIGHRIKLNSITLDNDINTDYKVMAVSHKGTISEAISGMSVTSVTCLPGRFDPIKAVK